MFLSQWIPTMHTVQIHTLLCISKNFTYTKHIQEDLLVMSCVTNFGIYVDIPVYNNGIYMTCLFFFITASPSVKGPAVGRGGYLLQAVCTRQMN